MLEFCSKHTITADVEIIPIQRVNEAFDRLARADVKYRFSIDMASLTQSKTAQRFTVRTGHKLWLV